MAFDGGAKRWAIKLATAFPLIAALAWSGSAAAGWPLAEPAQPLVQAPRICAAGVVPIDRRCKVVDFAELGEANGRRWFYAFYATHWADRHGRHDRGFPVVFYLQRPTTLRLSLWINDEPGLAGGLAHLAPTRPVVVVQPDNVFLGFTYKVAQGPDTERLFRLEAPHWVEIDVLHRSDADEAMIEAATPHDCEPADDGNYDWSRFRQGMAVKTKTANDPCGVLTARLVVKKVRVYKTDAALEPPATATSVDRRP